jgi:hypothetical protein
VLPFFYRHVFLILRQKKTKEGNDNRHLLRETKPKKKMTTKTMVIVIIMIFLST